MTDAEKNPSEPKHDSHAEPAPEGSLTDGPGHRDDPRGQRDSGNRERDPAEGARDEYGTGANETQPSR